MWKGKVKYNNTYNKEKYKRVSLFAPKEDPIWADLADIIEELKQSDPEMSVNKYVLNAVRIKAREDLQK